MKLTILYTYFNGFEQLKHSLSKMTNLVDEIILCYQTISNTGNYSDTIETEIEWIKKKYPSIIIDLYTTDLNLNTKENERRKHNQMIQLAKKRNATHFIISACDHVYTKQSINNALKSDSDVTFTRMITYYKKETWCVYPMEAYYMPFIHKMKINTIIVKENNYPVIVDPSVRVNTIDSFDILEPEKAILHHYSMVRNDVKNKFKNAASSVNRNEEKVNVFFNEYNNAKLGDKLTYFKGHELVHVKEFRKRTFGTSNK